MRRIAFMSWAFWLKLLLLIVCFGPSIGMAQPKQRSVLKGHEGSVRSVMFSPDGKVLASAGDDKVVKLWDVYSGRELATLKGHTDIVRSVAFSPDGKMLASAGQDHADAVKLWDVASRASLGPIKNTSGAWFVAFSHDGKTLAVPGPTLLEVASRKITGTPLEGTAPDQLCGVFSPNDKMIAAGSTLGIKIWDVVTGKVIANLNHEGHAVWSLAFSPDGRLLASGGLTSHLKLVDTGTWKQIEFAEVPNSVRSVAFSPDGKYLASSDEGGSVKLWNVATRMEEASLKSTQGQGQAVAFSPDGKMFASTGDNGSIVLWDMIIP